VPWCAREKRRQGKPLRGQPGNQRIKISPILSPHWRLLRRNDDGCLDAFKIAHGHVGVRVLASCLL